MIPGPVDLLSAYFVSIGETAGPIPDMWAEFLRDLFSDQTNDIPTLENKYLREVLNKRVFTTADGADVGADLVTTITYDDSPPNSTGTTEATDIRVCTLDTDGTLIQALQVGILTAGKRYRFKYTTLVHSGGGFTAADVGGVDLVTTLGSHEMEFISTTTGTFPVKRKSVVVANIKFRFDAIEEVLPTFTSETTEDLWKEYLDSRGFTGSVDDMAKQALDGDGLLVGAELLVNGTFDADTDWTKGTGWTIAGGVGAAATAVSSTALEQAVVTAADLYLTRITIVTISAGGFRFDLSDSLAALSPTYNTVGTFIAEITAATTTCAIRAVGTTTGTVDCASLRKILR